MKIEADSDSMMEYPHDDMPAMGMLIFVYSWALVPWWHNGKDIGLMIERSRVQLFVELLSCCYYLDGDCLWTGKSSRYIISHH